MGFDGWNLHRYYVFLFVIFMNSKGASKAMSQTMWILVAVVVAFIVALILINIFTGASSGAGKQGGKAIDDSGKGVHTGICVELCQECKTLYRDATGCGTARWEAMGGTSCPEAVDFYC